jgi:hypothetical protein
MTRLLLTLGVAIVLAGSALTAHHSFAAHYFEDQSVAIEGRLVEFAYRSPHSWVYVMAKDQDGQLQRFGAEWASPDRLRRQGITSDTLKVGDHLVITGSPGRDPSEYKVHLKGISRPADGWTWRRRAGAGRG